METINPKTLVRNRCDPKINKIETLAEYEVFKVTAYDLNSERCTKIKHKLNLVSGNNIFPITFLLVWLILGCLPKINFLTCLEVS